MGIYIDDSLVLRYVIPFAFADGYDTRYKVLEASEKWNRCEPRTKASPVFPYLYGSVCGTLGSNSMGSTWKYDFHNKLPRLRYCAGKESTKPVFLKLSDAGLYLFHTNVGLFWYELKLSGKDSPLTLQELILLQNRFKECSYTEKFFALERPRTGKTEPVFDPLDMAVWLDTLLKPLGQLCYLNGTCEKEGRTCPGKALIFNYALLEEKAPQEQSGGQEQPALNEELLRQAAFWLANGYTEKYLPSQEALTAGIQPFQDVCLYASRSGCGFYAIKNEGNGPFYSGNFNSNIRGEYFFLYILTLYQSFTLMNYARLSAEEFSSDSDDYRRGHKNDERLERFITELNTFLMKSNHTSVSSVQHHNEFYNYLKNRLMIREDGESLKTGTEALGDLQHLRQDRSVNIALAVLSLLSLFDAFQGVKSLIEKLRTTDWTTLWQQLWAGSVDLIVEGLAYLALIVFVGVCISVLISNFAPKGKKKKKKGSATCSCRRK